MRSRKIIISVLLLILLFSSGCSKKEEVKDSNLLSGLHYVRMIIKDYGEIVLELDADNAPITVTNFIKLVNDKFYDGKTFHRIITNVMIQAGETDEELESIKGEFKDNGINNKIQHTRGTISMIRDEDNDSATSEFFITLIDSPSFDGKYAAFGKVIKGMNVVYRLNNVEIIPETNGYIKEENRPIIESIREIDEKDVGERDK